MTHRSATITVLVGLLASAREAWADGVNPGITLTDSDWIKLSVIGAVVLVVGVLVVVAVMKKVAKSVGKVAKFAGAVRRELKETPSLPTARLHRDDERAIDPVATTPERH